MARPDVSPITEDLYEALGPWTLTGTKTVSIVERLDDDAYKLWVRTRVDETPVPTDPGRLVHWTMDDLTPTERAVVSQKPIGLTCLYETIDGWAWADVVSTESTWADVESDFVTWADLAVELP
jgi:hypothetical protein